MKKILLLAALEDEFGADGARRLSESCDVRFTGVGKLRAFEATLKALSGGDYDAVLNAGTCGSLRHATGMVLRPSVIVQGDIYVDSIFATPPEFAARGDEGVSIVSSDDFIGPDTAAERRASAGRYDCFDMESYAIARAVRFYADELGGRLPVSAFLKLVSDNADGDAGEWSVRIERLRPALVAATEEAVKELLSTTANRILIETDDLR